MKLRFKGLKGLKNLFFLIILFILFTASILVKLNNSLTKGTAVGLMKETKYSIKYLGKNHSKHFTTVVTILFSFKKSKHSTKEYKKWSETMLSSVSTPIIAYVDTFHSKNFINLCKKNKLTGKLRKSLNSYIDENSSIILK